MAHAPSDIQLDDCFVFLGMSGWTYKEQNLLIAFNIDFSGRVTFEWWVESHGLMSIRWVKKGEYVATISDVMEMIRQGIWDYVGKADQIIGHSIARNTSAEPKEQKKKGFGVKNIASSR